MDENQRLKPILDEFFCSKRYYSDMIFDLLKITSNRTKAFKDKLSDYHILLSNGVINRLSDFKKRPKHKYRMYIICGLRYVAFSYIDIPEGFVKKIIDGLDIELLDYSESDVTDLPLDFIITIYLFENSKIKYLHHIGPDHLAWLMNVLKYENLIDYRQQHRWTEQFEEY